jgi:putative thioredoxin
MINATLADFEQHVIEGSKTRPVLVDFWATWCQPCLALAPILEQLAAELGDKLTVVKVDIDREPQLAQYFQIRSVPSVKIFHQGNLVGEFSGVLPKNRILAMLAPVLPRDSDRQVERALETANDGDTMRAVDQLRAALADDAENWHIHEHLARLLLDARQLDEASAVLKLLPANVAQQPQFVALASRLSLLQSAAEAPELAALKSAVVANPADLETRFQFATQLAAAGDYDSAMENLVQIVATDRTFRDDGARRALLDIFELLNHEGPLVRRYRSRLAGLLN